MTAKKYQQFYKYLYWIKSSVKKAVSPISAEKWVSTTQAQV